MPALTQKRLGDGFYEQKLLREQVAQLTGRRFLAGYSSDEAEYRALMNAGVTYAKEHNLVPGVAGLKGPGSNIPNKTSPNTPLAGPRLRFQLHAP